MQTVKAVRAEGPVKKDIYSKFSTHPYHIWCDDGEVYISKFLQNPEGNLALVNEFVCYKLANLLNLPIPSARLIEVDDDFIETHGKEISDFIESPLQSGLHFGSKKVARISPVTSHKIIEGATNKSSIPSIILFDQLIANGDRDANRGNLLFDMTENKILMIDHSHVFKLGVIWDPIQLRRLIGEPFTVSEHQGIVFSKMAHVVKGNNPFNEILHKMGCISDFQVRHIIEEIPEEWNIDRECKNALCDFICDRLCRISEALAPLQSVLPYWKGGVLK